MLFVAENANTFHIVGRASNTDPMPRRTKGLSLSGNYTITCGQTLRGSVDDNPAAVYFDFVNPFTQNVTFTDCGSNFDPKLYLIDSRGRRIQSQSTNGCSGDDCMCFSPSLSFFDLLSVDHQHCFRAIKCLFTFFRDFVLFDAGMMVLFCE